MATIYFDLDGTLITYGEEFRDLFDRAIGEKLSDEIYDLYVSEILDNLEEMKEDPYRKAFQTIKEQFGLDINSEEVAKRYIEIEVGSTEVHHQTKKLLEELSEKHNLGILTNGDAVVQKRKIEFNNIDNYVDEVIVSNDVNIRKPDPEVFELAKRELPAEEFIYIGDTFDEDVKPAKEAGFKTIYINGEREADLEAQNPEKLAEVLLSILQ